MSTCAPRRLRRLAAASALLVVGLLVGCGNDDSSDMESGAGTESSAGPVAAGDPVARGGKLFNQHCAACHGTDLDGTETGPPLRSIVYEPNHHPDESFRRAVAQGVPSHHWDFGSMPPVTGLDDDEVDDIIAYVRHRQETDGFIR